MIRELPSPPRSGRELLKATKPFVEERRSRTWWLVGTTLGLVALFLTAAALLPWWPLRLVFSVLGGLVLVRAFILFHDFMHGAILRDSRLARVLMYGVGTLVLTPPRSWRESHNHHHANVGKIAPEGDSIPVVTTDIGAYLFYAQHSFPGARVYTPDEWNFFDAALGTASYFKLGRVMEWFTGAIGYHHVHHLNANIPFYRLREAMAAIPELQHPVVTRLHLRDIRSCFRANLWDPDNHCMVNYPD